MSAYWEVTVTNNTLGNQPVTFNSVKVKIPLSPRMEAGTGRGTIDYYSGDYDDSTGIWTITNLAAEQSAVMSFSISTPPTTVETPVRFYAEIIESEPVEAPNSRSNNATENWVIALGMGQVRTNGDAGVDTVSPHPPTERAATFTVRAVNFPHKRPRRNPGEDWNDNQYDVQVEISLSAGLKFASVQPPEPHGTTFDPDTGIWDIGTLEDTAANPENRKSLPVAVNLTSESLDNLPLERRCLTAKVTRAVPWFEFVPTKRLNDTATACLGNIPSLLNQGEEKLFYYLSCVGRTDYPCTDADTLELFASSSAARPEDVIVHIDDPAGRHGRGWKTGTAYEHSSTAPQVDGVGVTFRFVPSGFSAYTFAIRDVVPKQRPGSFTIIGGAPATFTLLDADTKPRLGPLNLPVFTTSNPYPAFLSFSTLGTYKVKMTVGASKAGTPYTASGIYTFHVGPIADLEVRDAGGPTYAVMALNNSQDTAPARVALSGVPEGAVARPSKGIYSPGACEGGVCGGVWDIGELADKDIRRASGMTEGPTLNIIAPSASAPVTAVIESAQDYVAVINGVRHTGPYYDHIPANNRVVVAPREGRVVAPGSPQRLRAQMFFNPSLPPMVLARWQQVERVNGRPVERYDVHVSAPPCEPPLHSAPVAGSVRGLLYLDESPPPAGEQRCYAVRAINSYGVPGHWSAPYSLSSGMGLEVSKRALTVAENGGRASYTVALESQPDNNVTVRIASADTGTARVSPIGLTFTPSNWDRPQTVRVTGQDDGNDNPNGRRETVIRHTLSGGGYDNVAAPTVLVTVTDAAGELSASVSKDSLILSEASGSGSYTVSLSQPAQSPVTLTVAAVGPVTVSPSRQTFAVGDRGPKTIRVTAQDDDIINPNDRSATISHTLSGGGYGGVDVSDVSVKVLDDDAFVGVTKSADTLTISENGGTGSYTLSLNKRPSGLVAVSMSVSGDSGAVRVTPPVLSFTPSDWSIPKTVAVVGVDDKLVTGARHAVINHAVAGGGYDGVTVGPVNVTVSDNDAPGITLSESGLVLSEDEGKRSATYLVSLSARPTGEVRVEIGSSDGSVARVNKSRVVFAPSEWNIPHAVTVTAQDDDAVNDDGARAATITHVASGGGFGGATQNLRVSVTDNDEIGVSVSTDLLYVSDGGRSSSYTVSLGSRPTHDVVITLTKADDEGAFYVPGNVVIKPDEWQFGKRVGVRSLASAAVGADATIMHTAASGDPMYDGIEVQTVSARIVPTPRVSIESVTKHVPGGTPARFEVRSDRVLFEGPLDVNLWFGANYRVLDESGSKTVTIPKDEDSVEVTVRTKNPWTTHPEDPDRTRPWCRSGGLHGNVSRMSDFSPYHFNEREYVWVRVFHSSEYPFCDTSQRQDADSPEVRYEDLIARIKADIQSPNYEGEEHDLMRALRTIGAVDYAGYEGEPVSVEEAAERLVLPSDNPHWEGIAEAIEYAESYVAPEPNATPAPTPAPIVTPEVSIAAGGGITEGGAATFTITANPAPAADLEVTVTVTQSGDFGAQTGEHAVTISTDGSATLTIATTDDEMHESDGEVVAAIEGGDGYAVSASASEAAVAVADDDPAPTEEQQPTSELSDDDDPSFKDEQQPKPEVSVTGGSGITEGGSATFTISVNPAPGTPLTVRVSVTASGDFGVETGEHAITISADGSATLTIATTDDEADEADGDIFAAIESGDGYVVSASAGEVAVAVADDD